jgi:Tol biopolymer transport system component
LDSFAASISDNGVYVAFNSNASNLVSNDTNGQSDVFIYSRTASLVQIVSVDSLGSPGNSWSGSPSISENGRYVAFGSGASNLVSGDTNGYSDIFVRDRYSSTTRLVSVASLGTQGNNECLESSISSDGRYVVFDSDASNLVPGDTNVMEDLFVHDCQNGVTERVSVDSFGEQASGNYWDFELSADGRFVVFDSSATNLVLGDTYGYEDIFVHDRWNGLGENSIYLAGLSTAPVLVPLDLTWYATRGNSHYWLAFSQSMNGAVIGGHNFDISNPMTVLAAGANAANGIGSFTSRPVPGTAAGLTFFFEVGARDAGGILYDSNVHAVTFY